MDYNISSSSPWNRGGGIKNSFRSGISSDVRAERPAEELYDIQKDPYEFQNLVDEAEHQDVLVRYAKSWVNGLSKQAM